MEVCARASAAPSAWPRCNMSAWNRPASSGESLDTDDALVRSGGLSGYFQSRHSSGVMSFSRIWTISTPPAKTACRKLEIALLLSCVRAQVEAGKAEAGL